MGMPTNTPGRPRDQHANSARPRWSLSEAARRTGTSRATLLRRIEAGKLPGAVKTDDGWSIGVDDLLGAGFTPDRPSPPDPVHGSADDLGRDGHRLPEERTAELEQQLALVRVQLAAAEQIAAERNRVIEVQAAALRMLEAGRPAPAEAPALQPPADQPQPPAVTDPSAERRPETENPLTWLRRRILG